MKGDFIFILNRTVSKRFINNKAFYDCRRWLCLYSKGRVNEMAREVTFYLVLYVDLLRALL